MSRHITFVVHVPDETTAEQLEALKRRLVSVSDLITHEALVKPTQYTSVTEKLSGQ